MDFEARTSHICFDPDLITAIGVDFECCFVVSATNSNSPRQDLVGFFDSVMLWYQMLELTPAFYEIKEKRYEVT